MEYKTLNELPKAYLYAWARKYDIKGRGSKTKAQLAASLRSKKTIILKDANRYHKKSKSRSKGRRRNPRKSRSKGRRRNPRKSRSKGRRKGPKHVRSKSKRKQRK
jgi:hypothetical protein